MLDLICMGSVDLLGARGKRQTIQNENSLPTAGFEPTTLRFVGRHSNSSSQVDQAHTNEIKHDFIPCHKCKERMLILKKNGCGTGKF